MAQEEIVKILKIDTGDSQQTVKGLREEIKDLRDGILNLEQGTEDYEKAVNKLQGDQRKLDQVMSLTKKTATALDGSYDVLTQKMSLLKAEWKATNDEAQRDELGKQIANINDQLKEMDSTVGNFQRNVGNYTESIVNAFDIMNQEIGEYQNKAAQAFQDGDAKAYADAIQEIGKRQGVLDQINKDSEFMNGSLEKRMQNITGIAEGVAGGFSALQGIMALTGNESEDFEKTMVKLSGAMAIVQGMQGIQGLVGGLKGAKVAIKAATVGMNGFKKALISTGIGAIVVLIGTLVANWEDLTNWVEKSIGSLNKFKEVFAGIKGSVGGFFENVFKGFGAVLKGNFDEAGEYMKKAVAFKANYEEAATAKSNQLVADAAKEKAAINAKEKEDYIADQEAKLGADWKWTSQGIAAYRKMYEERMKMYEKDTDEFKKAQRDKWSFERDLAERRNVKSPDVNALFGEIENGITIDDEPIATEEIDLGPDSNGAADDAAIKIKVKERAYRKEQNDLILMDEEERQKKEYEMLRAFQDEKMKLLQEASSKESDPQRKAELWQQEADLEIEIEKTKNEELARLDREALEHKKENQAAIIETFQATASAISTVLGGVADSYQADLDAQLAAGKITKEEYEKSFERLKAIQIAQATIDTISGAIAAYMSAQTLPPPFSFIVGGINAATVTAAGIAQIAQIKKTTPGSANVERGMVQPPANIFNEEPKATRNVTGFKETEELNKTQRVVILESDIQESIKRVEIRESESSF